MDTVGNGKADEEIGYRGEAEIGNDAHQGIHLVFLAHRPYLQKGEAGMHGQHHGRAQSKKKDIETG